MAGGKYGIDMCKGAILPKLLRFAVPDADYAALDSVAASGSDAVFVCLGAPKQEHFIVIMLNGAHEMIGLNVVTVGLVNRTLEDRTEGFET